MIKKKIKEWLIASAVIVTVTVIAGFVQGLIDPLGL